jgi:hypothetical protein
MELSPDPGHGPHRDRPVRRERGGSQALGVHALHRSLRSGPLQRSGSARGLGVGGDRGRVHGRRTGRSGGGQDPLYGEHRHWTAGDGRGGGVADPGNPGAGGEGSGHRTRGRGPGTGRAWHRVRRLLQCRPNLCVHRAGLRGRNGLRAVPSAGGRAGGGDSGRWAGRPGHGTHVPSRAARHRRAIGTGAGSSCPRFWWMWSGG